MSITFLYKNLIKNVTSITESEVSSTSGYGTANIMDDDINSVFRGYLHYNNMVGTTTILFTFGSAVYADSIACVSNIPLNGTLILRAGTTSSVGNFVSNIPLDLSGTSYKDISTQNYKYWRLDLHGQTGIAQHQLNEFFLGRRKVTNELPSYPVENGVEEDDVELISERGQRWIYPNFSREFWIFNFEGVNSTTNNDLYNMYKYCGKNTTPFWMILDENSPMDIRFCRFRENSFMSDQIGKNIFDITMEIEKEI